MTPPPNCSRRLLLLLLQSPLWLSLPGLAPPAVAEGPLAPAETALDRYIAQPDDAFQWKVVDTRRDQQATVFVVELTSQRWRSANEVDRTLWKHWLTVVRPDGARADTALLFIGGGSNGKDPPRSADPNLAAVAAATQSVVAELGMVPNQPLIFHEDGKRRVEDDLIGYAWSQFLRTRDPLWAPRLPMVKAVVRAMDAVQALLASEDGGQLQIKDFVVAGGSKRGWTTWMTAAVDPRVCAIAPIVIDVLNVRQSMDHHYRAYGFWAPAIGDYVHHGIIDHQDDPAYAELLALVDPYAYRRRFTMPKCIINATGDEFFLPDSWRFYFDDLPGEKHLCYVPNGNHSLRDTNALDTLLAFYASIVADASRPRYSWRLVGDNQLRVTCETEPRSVLLWTAENPQARDFRVESIGRAYASQPLQPVAPGVYEAEVATPRQGWKAFFVQLEFDVGLPRPLRVSTGVSVTPDTLPHEKP